MRAQLIDLFVDYGAKVKIIYCNTVFSFLSIINNN